MVISIIDVIKEKYPKMDSTVLANELNLSIYQLRRIVSKHRIVKSNEYRNSLHKALIQNKLHAYKNKVVCYNPTQIQENILIGSLLGDGNIACYGRSKESYYRDYRKWKAETLHSLDFK